MKTSHHLSIKNIGTTKNPPRSTPPVPLPLYMSPSPFVKEKDTVVGPTLLAPTEERGGTTHLQENRPEWGIEPRSFLPKPQASYLRHPLSRSSPSTPGFRRKRPHLDPTRRYAVGRISVAPQGSCPARPFVITFRDPARVLVTLEDNLINE